MRIHCPHCQNTIDEINPAAANAVCPACGSSIHLGHGSTTGYVPVEQRRRLGKFELIDQVGVGAFGTVYQARDTELDRIVAIKVPRAGAPIVSIHEVGQHDGLAHLVEDSVHGMTLADRLTGERLSPARGGSHV
jgi:serine/threonine protein kinase